MLLPTAGNSNTSERTELLDRLRAAFPDMKIEALMGDREFIGDAWMAYLQRENIPFILRLRENQHVLRVGYVALPISVIAQHLKVGEKMIVKGSCQLGRANETLSASVRLVITRLASGELLALACSGSAHHALARYRQRWTIETMFGNLKTKGFALEATHLTNPDKLSTLLALLAFAVALSVKTGVAKACLRAIPIKKHGRRALSLFALGLNTLRKIFAAASPDQIIAFLAQLLSPKMPIKPLLSLAFR
jgi:Transposase DDE domain